MCKHDWMMRMAGGLVAYWTRCPAQVHMMLKETTTQVHMDACVVDAGRGGVRASDCEWLLDRLAAELAQHKVIKRGKKKPMGHAA